MTDLDTAAIARGAVIAAAIALPAALILLLDEGSSLRGALILTIVGAFGLGGYVAGRMAPGRALVNGGIAALVPAVALLVLTIAVQQARGTSLKALSIPFSLLLALSCGVLGGLVAHRAMVGEEPARAAESGEGER
jgi:hypothetical protein